MCRSKQMLEEYTYLDHVLTLTVKFEHNVLFILDNMPVTFITYPEFVWAPFSMP